MTPPRKPPARSHAGPKSRRKPRRHKPAASRQAIENKWIYGLHAVHAALKNRARSHFRLVAQNSDVLPAEGPAPLDAEILSRDAIAELLPDGAVHQGLALLSELPPAPDLAAFCAAAPAESVVLVLDQVTDPRNLGAILRSAAGFAAAAVIVQDRHAPTLTGVVAKAASGGIESVPLIRVTNLARGLEQLAAADFWRFGLDGSARTALADARPAGGWRRVALVLGAEGHGLRPLVAKTCDELVKIPLPGGSVDSLNVAAAAAVALYELRRGG